MSGLHVAGAVVEVLKVRCQEANASGGTECMAGYTVFLSARWRSRTNSPTGWVEWCFVNSGRFVML